MEKKLDFVHRVPREISNDNVEFLGIHIFDPRGIRNENLMRTPGNWNPGVPITDSDKFCIRLT